MSDESRALNLSYYDDGDEMTEDYIHGESVEAGDVRDVRAHEDEDEEFNGWTREDAYTEVDADNSDLELQDPDFMKNVYYKGLRKIESTGLLDIGNLASWDVSSSKQGSGKEQLREDDPDTYWQSDGSQPHTITIHFAKRVSIQTIAIFTNYSLDESYTPSEIMIKAGTGEHDLQEVLTVNLKEPSGWSFLGFDQVLKAFLIKVIIKSNHQNGKDTHIRSLKVFQLQLNKKILNHSNISDAGFEFKSVKMLSESCIR